MTTPERRRLVAGAGALAAVVLVVVLAVALLGGGDDGDGAPPQALAARLVPADALVYLHLSTDTGRLGTRAAEAAAKAFPSYAGLKRRLVARLTGGGCRVQAASLSKGKEAGLALLDVGGGAAGSLVYVDTGNEDKQAERTCGGVQAGKFGRFLVIGQPQTIVLARQLAAGKGKSLAADAGYRRTLGELPAGRVADAWVTRTGVRRLLEPQGGVLGVAGTLLDQPGVTATAAALTAGDPGARLELRSLRTTRGGAPATFVPTLQDAVPSQVMGLLLLRGLPTAAIRLIGLGGDRTAALAPLLARAGRDLAPLARVFAGEVAVTVTRSTPAPIVTLTTKVRDEAAASRTLAAARPKVARLLAGADGATPEWKSIGSSYRLRPADGIEIDYAVKRGQVVVSTRLAGIAAVRDRKSSLGDTGVWRQTMGNTSNPVSSLVFLDFNQLLRLGEQTGLDVDPAYLAVKDDLQRLRSVGARSSTEGDESIVELFLSLP